MNFANLAHLKSNSRIKTFAFKNTSISKISHVFQTNLLKFSAAFKIVSGFLLKQNLIIPVFLWSW